MRLHSLFLFSFNRCITQYLILYSVNLYLQFGLLKYFLFVFCARHDFCYVCFLLISLSFPAASCEFWLFHRLNISGKFFSFPGVPQTPKVEGPREKRQFVGYFFSLTRAIMCNLLSSNAFFFFWRHRWDTNPNALFFID